MHARSRKIVIHNGDPVRGGERGVSVPRLSFIPIHVAILEGSHVAVAILS